MVFLGANGDIFRSESLVNRCVHYVLILEKYKIKVHRCKLSCAFDMERKAFSFSLTRLKETTLDQKRTDAAREKLHIIYFCFKRNGFSC